MSLAIVYTRANIGVDAPLVTVEVHLSNGLPGLTIVGLPETAVKESKERVRSAIINSNLEFPVRRITINLAPADLPKGGGRFDLAIAVGILVASNQIPAVAIKQLEFVGELALSGAIRAVNGVLPAVMAARKVRRCSVVPWDNAAEAGLLPLAESLKSAHLLDVCAHLLEQKALICCATKSSVASKSPNFEIDMADVKGQYQAKRALLIAAAGGHNLLMVGPPGTGKTLLANRLLTILPLLNEQEVLEVAAIRSVIQPALCLDELFQRPFRAPHHTASAVALIGGGNNAKPGEVSMAHHGVLFLDELPEFSPKVLEVLRQPMESGVTVISRANYQVAYPSNFQFLAAMNPCPCGYLGVATDVENELVTRQCRCSSEKIQRYHARISGPLLDRIDLHIEVPRLSPHVLAPPVLGAQAITKDVSSDSAGPKAETSTELRKQVEQCRNLQRQRAGKTNKELNNKDLDCYCRLVSSDQALLEKVISRLGLSGRAYHRILKVARTIADLDGQEHIQTAHLTEAINYRKFDRLQGISSVYGAVSA